MIYVFVCSYILILYMCTLDIYVKLEKIVLKLCIFGGEIPKSENIILLTDNLETRPVQFVVSRIF